MSNDIEKFEEWAIVEVFGHKRFAGLVTEQALGGASLVRIDVPSVETVDGETLPAFTKLFGGSSIYCITPCTEETAREAARQFRTRAFSTYDIAPPNRQLSYDDPDGYPI